MISSARDTGYAFWSEPSTGFKINYLLDVFHEIDYEVNEGYRRIPHGGIEIGGLLYGHSEAASATIEAFRLIECKHASGPSFVLSDDDLTRLREQISQAPRDPDLAGLQLLGWFIAHTRSSLEMTDHEASLFDEFFPQPGKIMTLVKPERFQPTRFAFLVRGMDGKMPRSAAENTIILPLPGRAGRAERNVQGSTPPAQKPASRRTSVMLDEVGSAVSAPPKNAPASATKPRPSIPPPDLLPQSPTPQAPQRLPHPLPEQSTNLVPYTPPLPSIEEIRRRRSAHLGGYAEQPALPGVVQKPTLGANLRLTLVLFLAAAFGCGVGYWAYLQLPSTTIPLYLQAQSSTLVVSWPPDQTRDCVFAALRIDDEQEVPLSLMQRAAGQATITATKDNLKIELVAQHWMRDSRGIVRYVKAQLPPPPSQPVQVR